MKTDEALRRRLANDAIARAFLERMARRAPAKPVSPSK
jgi:hypothetical protein